MTFANTSVAIKAACSGHNLSDDQQTVTVIAVGDDTSEGGEQEGGGLSGEAYHPQQQGRTGHPIDLPVHRHTLHPGANQRDALAGEE
jgi:hypothetical protein